VRRSQRGNARPASERETQSAPLDRLENASHSDGGGLASSVLCGDAMPDVATRDIPGIFNYCDRWCERCAFTARCRLYKDIDERGGHGTDGEMSMETTMAFVMATFAETRRMMEAESARRGIPLPTGPELEEIGKEMATKKREVEASAVVQLADRYTSLVDDWAPAERDLLRGKADALLARCERMEEPERIEAEARQVLDAFQVIEWYRHQIFVKIRRAASSAREGRWTRADANGSAKVALIGIDRSLAAWHVLRQWCPETTTHGVLIEVLTELRGAVEREFPKARAFRRPGFDSRRFGAR
jgi:hypothetical protein